MIGENAIAAVLVALLTGAMLTLALDRAIGNLWITMSYTVPASLILAGILFALSSDTIRVVLDKLGLGKLSFGGKKPPKDE